MKRAASYCRVSSVGQVRRAESEEGFSISAQRDACTRTAEELGAEIEHFTDIAESARTADRPGLQALLRRLKEKRDLDYVIVHKIDRLARSRADDVAIVTAIRAAGAQLVSVTENIDDTPTGSLLHGIMASVAEFYSMNLAAEAKKGLHEKARQGGTPGLAPIGYLNVRKRIDGREVRTIEIDSERAPHLQWAFAAYASGAYTLDTLYAALAERGLRTRETAKRTSKPLNRSRIAKVLGDPYYVGRLTYGGVQYEGRHEPMIDKPTFERVQQVLAAHSQAGEKDRKHRHYLKGSLYCGRCGSRMTYVKARGNGGTYEYFGCIGRITRTGCEQRYVAAEAVEEKVADAYAQVRMRYGGTASQVGWERHLDELRALMEEALGSLREQSTREVRRQRLRIEQLREQREKLLHSFYANAIPLELLKAEQDRITIELDQAERRLEVAEQSAADVSEAIEIALDLARDCENAYRRSEPSMRRSLNQAFLTKLLIVDDEALAGKLAEPFASLLSPELRKALASPTEPARAGSSNGHGSKERLLVGETGFEPATFRPPAGCATRLRHSPGLFEPSAARPERATGLEPVIGAWKAPVLPLHHARGRLRV
jgi:site-specific DNA recombinase